MVYIVKKEPPKFHQMTWEELLDPNYTEIPKPILNITNTHTYELDKPSEKLVNSLDMASLIGSLQLFNAETARLHEAPREKLYTQFKQLKRKGGYRTISKPDPILKIELSKLKTIFETVFGVLYHTNAYAYIKRRSTEDSVKKHQANDSHWIAKLDMKDFFGSITLEYMMRMFSMIFPFSEVVKTENGRVALETALELCILDGGLPQGSPISPLLTNIVMIPFDFRLTRALQNFNGQKFVYTRYADDILITSRKTFDVKKIETLIDDIIRGLDAPIRLNPQKTQYVSRAGENWVLGVMWNKDNQITIGNKKKKQYGNALHNYAMDRLHGTRWDLDSLQTLMGQRSYYLKIENSAILEIENRMSRKFRADIIALIKEDMKTL